MDLDTVYIRTEKGDAELANDQFALELHDILSRVDGMMSAGEMMQDGWTQANFEASLQELLDGGYIQPLSAVENSDEGHEYSEEEFAPGKSKFARSRRTLIASVLFLDIVEYTRKPVADQFRIKEEFNKLVYELVREIPDDDRIIIDTGDGAALGFLADPDRVLSIAVNLRLALEASHPDFQVRMGINLGPVKLVADMNGRENLIGDGVNDANRVMGFANGNQILVSRSFFDVVSRLSKENQGLFKYQGVHRDKHRREHEIYEVVAERADEEQVREKTQEEIKAERLEKMRARLDAAAKAEAEAEAAKLARERIREAAETEMRKKAEARMLSERAPVQKPFPIRAILAASAVFLVIFVAILPFVPLEFLARHVASSLANQTQETVTIESASFSLFPTPRINLKQVSIGGNLRISRASEILFADTVLFEGVAADQDVLRKIPEWGGLARKIELNNVTLSLEGRPLPAFSGGVDLGSDGSFRHAHIQSGGMSAEISPGYRIDLDAKNWALPFGPQCPWTEIHARAVASDGEVKILSWDASGYGGEWSGSGSIAWGGAWRASGRFKGKNLDIGNLMPFFSANAKVAGTLEFDAAMASIAPNFSGLFDSPRFNAAFRISDGKIGNIDISQAIRSPSPGGTRGGETKFDALSGALSASGKDYRYDQIRMTSGLMKVSGGFVLREGRLSGRMNVSLDRVHSPLALDGSLSDPVIR